MRVHFGWPIGMPLVRSLKDGLWEVRSHLPSQKIARLILCFHKEDGDRVARLHQEDAEDTYRDLELAKRRLKEVMQ